MKHITLSELITLISASMGTFEVALYEEDSHGDVYETDSPVGFYEVTKEYFLGQYTYRHVADKKLVNFRDFGDLHVIGICKSTDCEHNYPLCVCVKVAKNQVKWG